jgi:hypothetical protein
MALGFFKKLFNGIKKVGSTIYNKAIKPVYNALAPMAKAAAPAIGILLLVLIWLQVVQSVEQLVV